jgi:hypothetical protein
MPGMVTARHMQLDMLMQIIVHKMAQMKNVANVATVWIRQPLQLPQLPRRHHVLTWITEQQILRTMPAQIIFSTLIGVD